MVQYKAEVSTFPTLMRTLGHTPFERNEVQGNFPLGGAGKSGLLGLNNPASTVLAKRPFDSAASGEAKQRKMPDTPASGNWPETGAYRLESGKHFIHYGGKSRNLSVQIGKHASTLFHADEHQVVCKTPAGDKIEVFDKAAAVARWGLVSPETLSKDLSAVCWGALQRLYKSWWPCFHTLVLGGERDSCQGPQVRRWYGCT